MGAYPVRGDIGRRLLKALPPVLTVSEDGDTAARWASTSRRRSQLASRVGVSRSAFARRFTTLVGQPPLAYLTQWCMTIASDLLSEPDATIADVAKRVGYADAFNFSAAFKRVKGMSPSNHRSQRARPVVSTRSALSTHDQT